MEQLYDFGYQAMGKKPADMLVKTVHKMNAVIVDVRFSTRSRDFQWNGTTLTKGLGESHYVWLKELGNVNYKNEGPIEFQDLKAGMARLAEILERNPAILLCGCWKRSMCHRLVIAKRFEISYGQGSMELTVKDIEAMIAAPFDPVEAQGSLFE